MVNYLIHYNYKYFLFFYVLFIQFNNITGINTVSTLLKKTVISENMLKLISLSLSYSLQPQIKKLSFSNLEMLDSLALNHMIQTLIILIFFICSKKKDINLCELKVKCVMYSVISNILTFYQTYQLNRLIRTNNVSSLIPLMNCYINLFSILIGYVFFNENINKKTFFGIIFISIGSKLVKS